MTVIVRPTDVRKEKREQHHHHRLRVNVSAGNRRAEVFESKNGQEVGEERHADDDVNDFHPNDIGNPSEIGLCQFLQGRRKEEYEEQSKGKDPGDDLNRTVFFHQGFRQY